MYYIDYHSHCNLSPDSEATLESQVQAAIGAGLSELCITDHYDILTLEGEPEAPCDWDYRRNVIQAMQEKYRDQLTLRFGVELGSGHLDASPVENAPAELDFIIGSVHNRSPENGGLDISMVTYTSLEMCQAALDDYLPSLRATATAGLYDVLGHVIYPMRYFTRDGLDYTMDHCRDEVAEILRLAIAQGKGIEMNTYAGRTLAAWKPWLKMYQDLGGELITVGSDSHFPATMGAGIPEAYAILKEMGFPYVAKFQRRVPSFIKL